MKSELFLTSSCFIIVVFLISCGVPKYTYQFNHHTVPTDSKYTTAIAGTSISNPLAEGAQHEVAHQAVSTREETSLQRSSHTSLYASISNNAEPILFTPEVVTVREDNAVNVNQQVERKSMKRKLKSLSAPAEGKDPEKKRSFLAVAGFVTSLAALSIVALAVLFGFNGAISIPLILIGIVLSAIGLKSKNKRGWAIAGLTLGLVFIVTLIIALASWG